MKGKTGRSESIDKPNHFRNDNTPKGLGIDYQKLIALEYCLNAKKNEYIWIECKGDVADQTTSVEVKHHQDSTNLTSNSVDAWKTLYNYVVEQEVISQFDHLVLHTTSKIPANSIFYQWNELPPEIKLKTIIGHVPIGHEPVSSIKVYYDKIIDCPKNTLLEILNKFSILHEQPNISTKWEEIKEHPKLELIQENRREIALKYLYGYITKIAIDNSDEWRININDFNRDFRNILSEFTAEEVPFPIIEKTDISQNSSEQNYEFIKKMKAINLKDKDQCNAVCDYIRANICQFRLLSMEPTLKQNLNFYDGNICDMLENEKSHSANNLSKEIIGTEEAHRESRNLYYSCIGKPHDLIVKVSGTQKYYRDGRIHHIAEETDYMWKYEEDDL